MPVVEAAEARFGAVHVLIRELLEVDFEGELVDLEMKIRLKMNLDHSIPLSIILEAFQWSMEHRRCAILGTFLHRNRWR